MVFPYSDSRCNNILKEDVQEISLAKTSNLPVLFIDSNPVESRKSKQLFDNLKSFTRGSKKN